MDRKRRDRIMNKSPAMMVLLCTMLIFLGCSRADTPGSQTQSLTVPELSKLLRGGKPPRIIYAGSLLQWRDAHIPAARYIPCDASEAITASLLQEPQTLLVLYGNRTLQEETCPLVSRLARAGKAPLLILSGGLAAWKKNGLATASIERIPRLAIPGVPVAEWKNDHPVGKKTLMLDIRPMTPSVTGPIPDALNIPLSQLHERYGEIPLDRPVVVVDADDGETLLAASFLIRKGVSVIGRLEGGVASLNGDRVKGGKGR